MQSVRHLMTHRHLAVLLCAATLLLKLLVPTGFMIASDHGRVVMTICSGTASSPMAMDGPTMHGDMAGHGKPADGGKTEMPCAFSRLVRGRPGSGRSDPARRPHRLRHGGRAGRCAAAGGVPTSPVATSTERPADPPLTRHRASAEPARP